MRLLKSMRTCVIRTKYAETCIIVLQGRVERSVCVSVSLMFRGVVQQKGPRVHRGAGRSVTFCVRDTAEQRGVWPADILPARAASTSICSDCCPVEGAQPTCLPQTQPTDSRHWTGTHTGTFQYRNTPLAFNPPPKKYIDYTGITGIIFKKV